jgi:hypothetical protein
MVTKENQRFLLVYKVMNDIVMKITVWLIPTRQRFDNCLLKKFNYTCIDLCFLKLNIGIKYGLCSMLKKCPGILSFVSHLHPAARQFCRSTYTITDNTIK